MKQADTPTQNTFCIEAELASLKAKRDQAQSFELEDELYDLIEFYERKYDGRV